MILPVTAASTADRVTLTSSSQRRTNRALWWLTYVSVVTAGLGIAGLALLRPGQPYLGVGLALLGLLLAAWVWRPRDALVLTVALALVGDIRTVWWWPFVKNLSSQESIMFLAHSISFSPFEITLVWALVVTAYRNLATIGRPFRSGPLVWPLAIFGIFVMFGIVNGLSSGGNTRAAIFEVRSLLYLPLVYLLVVNVCRQRRDYALVFAGALAAVFVQSLLSLQYLFTLPADVRDNLVTLNEHGSALGMNLVLVFLIASVTYRAIPRWIPVVLFVAAIPVVWVYFVAQRRVAVIALVLAVALLALLLLWRQPRTFRKVVPVLAIVGIGYLGAFWNSTESAAGFPAQAVKSAFVSSNELDEDDAYSNLYREIETVNLYVTIRSSPVTGLGFGQPFYQTYTLADISFFEFYAYLPHNSLLWIWIKTGFAGFVTILFLFARTLMQGARRARVAATGTDALVASGAVLFVAMYAIYLYVEIGWEPRNVLLLAVSMGLCTTALTDDPEADGEDPEAVEASPGDDDRAGRRDGDRPVSAPPTVHAGGVERQPDAPRRAPTTAARRRA